jgi:translation initiation factor IF-3
VIREEGVRMAEEKGLDLVEVADQTTPPVCRIMNYGKYLYEQEKKKKEARKKQKTIVIKEIKVRPKIEEHDYQVKLRNAQRFLEHQDKVKITMTFRGREMSHRELGKKIIDRMVKDLSEIAQVEKPAMNEGWSTIIYLAPKASK